MSSSESSFQVVSRGWLGHVGKIAPLVMTISAPQQTLLYTPKFSFTLPLCGTVTSYASVHLRTLAHIVRTLTRTHFRWLIRRTGLPLGAKRISPSQLFGRVSALLRRSESAVVIEPHAIHRLIHNWQADVDFIVHSRSQRQSLAGDLNFVFLDRQEKIFGLNKD